MRPLLVLILPLGLAACAPATQSSGTLGTLQCTGERLGTLTRVPFTLSANLDHPKREVAGVLTEPGGKAFWVYGRYTPTPEGTQFILSVESHTESFAGVDLIFKKGRAGYFTSSSSLLSGTLQGEQFGGRQKAGVNNYTVRMTCRQS
ncbi:hypothetical protein [Deinococcus maricopensis]|uniref:Lipoprotein n=1 Tax=Deinococcus maricopensis (strain DSM 21211 / LMG 22137 / NRRL B-23946 / LB-34) TaxID=709986 RepID=E8U3D2_DEIML|nr:hypothetical protein [Deinococcus maricopensis]ADV65803.1 hypothetical protein Deima_0139 [Deinococcus maricopensis DSM 21211]